MIFVLPLIFACALLIFFNLRAKNKQREMLIEQGINPDGISIVELEKITNLTNGILFFSLGLGLLCGYAINELLSPENFFVIYLISVFCFCGCGFLVNFYVYKRMKVIRRDERSD